MIEFCSNHGIHGTATGSCPLCPRKLRGKVGWFVGVKRLFVTVMDISRPCQPEKLIPLLPWPGFDPSFSGHNDRWAIISEWTRLRLRPLSHQGWLRGKVLDSQLCHYWELQTHRIKHMEKQIFNGINYLMKIPPKLTRLLGRPQPQMYPPVALNQYKWVNRTHKHFFIYASRPHDNFEIDFTPKL